MERHEPEQYCFIFGIACWWMFTQNQSYSRVIKCNFCNIQAGWDAQRNKCLLLLKNHHLLVVVFASQADIGESI